jgi:hypothetical protein
MDYEEPGYLLAIIGGLLGMTTCGLIAGCAGFAYFSHQLRDDPYGLPGFGAMLVAVPAALIGQVLGCWLILRREDFDRAGLTSALLIPITIAGAIVAFWVVSRTDDIASAVFFILLYWPFIAPALARAIVVRVGLR